MLKKTVSNPPSSYPSSDSVIKKATKQGGRKDSDLPSLILIGKCDKSFKLIYGWQKICFNRWIWKILPIIFFFKVKESCWIQKIKQNKPSNSFKVALLLNGMSPTKKKKSFMFAFLLSNEQLFGTFPHDYNSTQFLNSTKQKLSNV